MACFRRQSSSGTEPIALFLPPRRYATCNFGEGHATELFPAANQGGYVFTCDDVGSHLFSCSQTAHCSTGKQKVVVQVVDWAKTAAHRAMDNQIAESRARGVLKQQSLAQFMANQAADYTWLAPNGITTANEQEIYDRLWCVFSHIGTTADGMGCAEGEPCDPTACSDWFPDVAPFNSGGYCLAFVLTELGYVERKRPTADLVASRQYYEAAIALQPTMCSPLSYLAELEVQEGNETAASMAFTRACDACGRAS